MKQRLSNDHLNKYSVQDLKNYCRDHNLPLNGKKADLIARIVAHHYAVEANNNNNTSSTTTGSPLPSQAQLANARHPSSSIGPTQPPAMQNSGLTAGFISSLSSSPVRPSSIPIRRNPDDVPLGAHHTNVVHFSTSTANKRIDLVPNSWHLPTSKDCYCKQAERVVMTDKRTIRCVSCSALNHLVCTRYNGPQEKYYCPHCRLVKLDPFLVAKRVFYIGRATTFHILAGLPGCNFPQAGNNVTVASLDCSELRVWRSRGYEVIIRCVAADTCDKNLTQMDWTMTLQTVVNKVSIEPVNAPTWEHKRRDTPVNIIQYLHTNGPNRIQFTASNTVAPKLFVLGVFLCEPKSPKDLAVAVMSSSMFPYNSAKKRVESLVANKQSHDDVECLEQNRRIKLTCPISLMRMDVPAGSMLTEPGSCRMDVPARGLECKHLECFGLESYLEVTRSTRAFNNRWRCPHCHLFVRPDSFVVDGYVQHLLQQTQQCDKVVEILQDTQWRVVSEVELKKEKESEELAKQMKSGSASTEENNSAPASMDVECLDSDSDDGDDVNTSTTGTVSSSSTTTATLVQTALNASTAAQPLHSLVRPVLRQSTRPIQLLNTGCFPYLGSGKQGSGNLAVRVLRPGAAVPLSVLMARNNAELNPQNDGSAAQPQSAEHSDGTEQQQTPEDGGHDADDRPAKRPRKQFSPDLTEREQQSGDGGSREGIIPPLDRPNPKQASVGSSREGESDASQVAEMEWGDIRSNCASDMLNNILRNAVGEGCADFNTGTTTSLRVEGSEQGDKLATSSSQVDTSRREEGEVDERSSKDATPSSGGTRHSSQERHQADVQAEPEPSPVRDVQADQEKAADDDATEEPDRQNEVLITSSSDEEQSHPALDGHSERVVSNEQQQEDFHDVIEIPDSSDDEHPNAARLDNESRQRENLFDEASSEQEEEDDDDLDDAPDDDDVEEDDDSDDDDDSDFFDERDDSDDEDYEDRFSRSQKRRPQAGGGRGRGGTLAQSGGGNSRGRGGSLVSGARNRRGVQVLTSMVCSGKVAVQQGERLAVSANLRYCIMKGICIKDSFSVRRAALIEATPNLLNRRRLTLSETTVIDISLNELLYVIQAFRASLLLSFYSLCLRLLLYVSCTVLTTTALPHGAAELYHGQCE